MSAVIEIFVGLMLLFGAGDIAMRGIHEAVKKEAVVKIQKGLPSLESYTKKLTRPGNRSAEKTAKSK